MARVFSQNIIEMAIVARYGGAPHVNVLHFYNDEGEGSDASKVKDVMDNWQDHIMSRVDNGYELQGIEWRSLDPDDNNVGTLAPTAGKRLVGALSGTGQPSSLCYLITKATQNRPRGRRDGRIFLSGVEGGIVGEDGTLGAVQRGLMQTACNAFLSGVNDNAWGVSAGSGLAVLETTPESRAPGPQAVTIGYRAVVALPVATKVAHQRDRIIR